jgi:hypothetical protein
MPTPRLVAQGNNMNGTCQGRAAIHSKGYWGFAMPSPRIYKWALIRTIPCFESLLRLKIESSRAKVSRNHGSIGANGIRSYI